MVSDGWVKQESVQPVKTTHLCLLGSIPSLTQTHIKLLFGREDLSEQREAETEALRAQRLIMLFCSQSAATITVEAIPPSFPPSEAAR